jgi:hypothetical protein
MKNVNVGRNVEDASRVLAEDIRPLEEEKKKKGPGKYGVIGVEDGCFAWQPTWTQSSVPGGCGRHPIPMDQRTW